MIQGNRCEKCHADDIIGRWEPTHGSATIVCRTCAVQLIGALPTQQAAPRDESRVGEVVTGMLQGQIAALRDDVAGLARKVHKLHSQKDSVRRELWKALLYTAKEIGAEGLSKALVAEYNAIVGGG